MFSYFKIQEAENGVIYRNRLKGKITDICNKAFEGNSYEELMKNFEEFINLTSLIEMSRSWDDRVLPFLNEEQKKVYTVFPISLLANEYEFYINYRYFHNLNPDEFIRNDFLMKEFNIRKNSNNILYLPYLEDAKKRIEKSFNLKTTEDIEVKYSDMLYDYENEASYENKHR